MALIATLFACASDDEADTGSSDPTHVSSGFGTGMGSSSTSLATGDAGATTEFSTDTDIAATDPTSSTTDVPTTSAPSTASSTASETSDTEDPSLGNGDLRGILTFARYGADPLNEDEFVGFAGAWRIADMALTDVHDFFGLWGLDTPYPIPPETPDHLEHNGLLGGFDWGAPTDWLLAGNAMSLARADVRVDACLLYLGGTAEVVVPGLDEPVPNYPIYAATNSSQQPPECAPALDDWEADADYDLVLFGGALFPNNRLRGAIHTPPLFEIETPEVTRFLAPIDSEDDLIIRWTANANEGDRFIIRGRDMFGRMFTVNAVDDGEYVIPAADLQELDAGPMTLMFARENPELVPFSDGTVNVLTRFEQRAYFELL